MVTRIDRILREKRAVLLSLDEGIEEGPKAFTLTTVDPAYILNIAIEGGYTGLIVNPGIAEKYLGNLSRDVPIIINLNAKGNHPGLDPAGSLICTVERAVKLGAQAVAYTLYDGTPTDPSVFSEFGRVVEHAHDYGIPVIAWMYPRGAHDHNTDRDAYAVRLALELGADAVGVRFSGDAHAFSWIVKCAGKAAVLAVEGTHSSPKEILTHARGAIHAGASGIIHGKSVWSHSKPFSLTRATNAVVFKDKTVDEALKYVE